jgi:hypothetical protein
VPPFHESGGRDETTNDGGDISKQFTWIVGCRWLRADSIHTFNVQDNPIFIVKENKILVEIQANIQTAWA